MLSFEKYFEEVEQFLLESNFMSHLDFNFIYNNYEAALINSDKEINLAGENQENFNLYLLLENKALKTRLSEQ